MQIRLISIISLTNVYKYTLTKVYTTMNSNSTTLITKFATRKSTTYTIYIKTFGVSYLYELFQLVETERQVSHGGLVEVSQLIRAHKIH